jgi:hypothetical protein
MRTFLLDILPEVGFLVLVAAAFLGWLCFMILEPERWSHFVDKENAFWVRLRICSPSFAETSKRFEKGLGFQILVGTVAALSFLVLLGAGVLAIRLALMGSR